MNPMLPTMPRRRSAGHMQGGRRRPQLPQQAAAPAQLNQQLHQPQAPQLPGRPVMPQVHQQILEGLAQQLAGGGQAAPAQAPQPQAPQMPQMPQPSPAAAPAAPSPQPAPYAPGAMPGAQGPQPPQPDPAYGTPWGVDPNDLLGRQPVGQHRMPLEHLQYWAAHGWMYDPNSGQFVQQPPGRPNAGGGGGGQPGPGFGGPGDGRPNLQGHPGFGGPGDGRPNLGGGGGGLGDGSGAGAPGMQPGGGGPIGNGQNGLPQPGQPPAYTGGLPLDPYFEAQRRSLEDQMAAQLAPLSGQREQLAANQQLQTARLGTNEGVDLQRMLESLAERGVLTSGVQTEDRGQLATDYLRQRQDLANSTAGGYADLASQEGEIQGGYQRGLQEALLEAASRAAQDPNTPTPHRVYPTPDGNTPGIPPRRRSNGRRGNRRH